MATVTMMAYPGRDSYPTYSQQYAMYQARAPQSQAEMAQTMQVNPYATYSAMAQPQPYQHQSSPRSPRSAGSPGSDDGSKPSLPSISNLLGIADRPASARSTQHTQTPAQQMHEQHQPTQTSPRSALSSHIVARAPTSHPSQETSTSPRSVVPGPPSMRNDSVLEATQSPSAISTASAASGPSYYVHSSINNVEPADQRNPQASLVKRASLPSLPDVSPYGQARYTASPYATSPSGASATSYYSPTAPAYPAPTSLYQQRPLPSNFPPPAPIPVQSNSLPTSNPWEHHHYISPSSQSTFPQSQDRYICPTCNKAFSRPSSLKIHSHSHTGEKPFRCPHAGCGKAFSVRSNMKRHERGCHSGIPAPPPAPVPHMQAPQHPHMQAQAPHVQQQGPMM